MVKVMRTIAGSMLILAAAACSGDGSSTSDNAVAYSNGTAPVAAAPSNAQRAVSDLPEGQRNGVLFRAIRDARQACQNVRESLLSETPSAVPVYMATCENNAVYAVAIQDDGTAIVQPVMPAEEGKQ